MVDIFKAASFGITQRALLFIGATDAFHLQSPTSVVADVDDYGTNCQYYQYGCEALK